MKAEKPLRQRMPLVTAWIDNMRAAFGTDCVDNAIRGGMAGLPAFWASEDGSEVGSRDVRPVVAVSAREMVLTSAAEALAASVAKPVRKGPNK